MEEIVQTTDLESRFKAGMRQLFNDVKVHGNTYYIKAYEGCWPCASIFPCDQFIIDGNTPAFGEIVQVSELVRRFAEGSIRLLIYDVKEQGSVFHVYDGCEPWVSIMPYGETEVTWIVGFGNDEPFFEERTIAFST